MDFTAADLGRTRVVPTAGALVETVLALGVVSGRYRSVLGPDWTQPARRRTSARDVELGALLHPRAHVMLDLFTLTGLPETIREGEAELARLDPQTFAVELAAAAPRSGPDWLPGLDEGDATTLRRLGRAMSEAYSRLVGPYWSAFGELIESHRQHLVRSLGEHGAASTLARFAAGTWDGTVLHLPEAGQWSSSGDVYGRLRGQGVLLAPSVLCTTPVPYFPLDADRPAVLLCPVPRRAPLGVPTGPPAGPHRLLGRTRTTVLRVVADQVRGGSTSEVAELAGISGSTASEHLTVLRSAGLVHSARHGHRMVHVISPLGRRMIEADL